MTIRVDDELRNLIPPLSGEEFTALEDSLLKEGCRDALVLWGDTLVDGHNRYEICQRHDIPFQTIQKDFASRADAKIWMVQNQLARRNLLDAARINMIRKIEPEVASQAKQRQGARNDLKDNIPQKSAECCKDTRDVMAKLAGTSHDTYTKVKKVMEAVEPEIQEQMLEGEISINEAYNRIKKAKKQEEKRLKKESDRHEQKAADDNYQKSEVIGRHAVPGAVYRLGRHRLMCGDATSASDIQQLMEGATADMILSDPPYGMNLDTDFSGAVSAIVDASGNRYDRVIGDNEDFTSALIETFFDNFGYCKEMFLFGADYYSGLIPDRNAGSWLCWDKRRESQADGIGSEFELIWSRTRHKRRMLRHDWFGFLSSEDAKDAQNRVHPTQKPVSLLVDIIQQWGDGANAIVDLYGGSGSTLIACEKLNRICYMMELSPGYVDVIIDRWEKLTGEKAKRCNV